MNLEMVEQFDYDKFYSEANSSFITQSEHLRYGQYLMNQLSEKFPEIVVPEEADCYYDNQKVPAFLNFIAKI